MINLLRANDIKIFDGKWLEKYLILDILEYIINKKQIIKAETEIAITANEITDLLIEMIKILSKQYKKLTIVTNHIEKLRKIEKEIKENIRIDAIRFNGIVINDYEIEIGRKEFIWRDGIEKYRQRDLIEAELYVRDTYKNIRKKIQKNNIKIKELYGINGIVKI